MKMMACLAASFALIGGSGYAGELEEKISSLRKNYDALEGYWAMYDARTETGKTATFEQGADFASGWAFVRIELRDAGGKHITSNEQWATKEGDYVIRNDDQVLVFTGLNEMGERCDQLRKVFKRNGEISPMRVAPNCYLTETGVTSVVGGVGFSTAGRDWFSGIEDLISATETEITLNWGEHGTIILDPSSGLLISQVITLDKGKREMKRTDWQKNPGEKMISTRMNINLNDAGKSALVELGMGRKMLGAILQSLIKEVGKEPQLGNDLQEFLNEREDAVTGFLDQEILKGAPFPNDEFLFKAIEDVALNAQEHLRKNGKDLPLERLFQDVGFRSRIIAALTKGLIEKAEGLNRKQCVEDALAGPLLAQGETEEAAKRLVEASVERAYYRARFRKTLDAFREQRWGK